MFFQSLSVWYNSITGRWLWQKRRLSSLLNEKTHWYCQIRWELAYVLPLTLLSVCLLFPMARAEVQVAPEHLYCLLALLYVRVVHSSRKYTLGSFYKVVCSSARRWCAEPRKLLIIVWILLFLAGVFYRINSRWLITIGVLWILKSKSVLLCSMTYLI